MKKPMRILYSALAILLSSSLYAQEFKTSMSSTSKFNADYISSAVTGVFTSDGKLIHQNDNVEVINLNSGKVEFKFDFEGKYGQSWIDGDGRYVGNYSQNARQLETGWTDAVHVLDLETKKVYTKMLDIGY